MSAGANYFLKKTLGEDFFESLNKVELWKPGTRTTLDHEEIKTALKIVPRTVMALLIRELTPMQIGETKEIQLNVISESAQNAMVRVSKHERDVYSGDIEQENKKVVDFKYRSIPGVGLVIMSAFELYDVEELSKPINQNMVHIDQNLVHQVQAMIDERLAMHDLVGKVVDKKIAEKDAVQQLILEKLTAELEKKKKQISELTEISKTSAPMSDPYFQGMANGMIVADAVVNDKHDPKFVEAKKKGSPLKAFLDDRQKKLKKTEFIELKKGEKVDCPDCGKSIFNGDVFAGCVCLGDDRDKKVYLTKTEEGYKIRFGKGWDAENIEMLLEVLRSKRG